MPARRFRVVTPVNPPSPDSDLTPAASPVEPIESDDKRHDDVAHPRDGAAATGTVPEASRNGDASILVRPTRRGGPLPSASVQPPTIRPFPGSTATLRDLRHMQLVRVAQANAHPVPASVNAYVQLLMRITGESEALCSRLLQGCAFIGEARLAEIQETPGVPVPSDFQWWVFGPLRPLDAEPADGEVTGASPFVPVVVVVEPGRDFIEIRLPDGYAATDDVLAFAFGERIIVDFAILQTGTPAADASHQA